MNQRNKNKKRTLLIYTRNYYEIRVLYLSEVLKEYEEKYSISILYDQKYENYDLTKFVKYDQILNKKISIISTFFLKFKIYFYNLYHFFLNSHKSESSIQMLIFYLVSLPSYIYKKVKINPHILFFLYNNNIFLDFIRLFSKIFLRLQVIFPRHIQTPNNKSNNLKFDAILLGSPSTLDCKSIIKKYSHAKTKKICLLRNLDTLPCKGFFPLIFDIVIYPFEPIGFYLSSLYFSKKPKKYLFLKSYSKNLKKNLVKKEIPIISFAGGADLTNHFDPEIAFLVFKLVKENIKKEYKLQLRVTPKDNLLRYENLLSEFKYEKYIVPEVDFNPKTIKKDLKEIGKVRLVISSTSTFVVDSSLIGITSALYNPELMTKSLYKREHIKTIKNFYKVPIFNNQDDLKNFIINSLSG